MARIQTQDDIEYEKEFTRKNTWANFKMAMFGSLSMATFVAALQTIVTSMVKASESLGTKAVLEAASNQSTGFFASLFTNPLLTGPLLAGMIAVGVTAAYLSVAEGTEVKRLQDDRLARQNAREQQRCKEQGICNDVEYPQNQRADGKSWQQAVTNKPDLVVSR